MQGNAVDFERLRRNLVDKSIESSIDSHFPDMEWSDDDIIMDIGCGPGRTTKDILLPRCPKFKKIVAIDVNLDYIKYAKETYFHDKIEYKSQDILQSAEVEGTGKYDKIVSFYVFQYVYDYEILFSVISSILKPGGYFSFIYLTKCAFYSALLELSFHEEGKKYLKTEDIRAITPPSEYWRDTESEFKIFVSKFGLRVTKSKCQVMNFELSNKQHFLDSYFAFFPKIILKNLDPEAEARFRKLVEPIVLKSCLQKENGKIIRSCEVLQVSGMKTR